MNCSCYTDHQSQLEHFLLNLQLEGGRADGKNQWVSLHCGMFKNEAVKFPRFYPPASFGPNILERPYFFFQSLFFLLYNSYELSEKSSLKFVAKCKGKIVLPDTFSFGAFTQDMSLLIMDNGYNSGRNHSHDLSLDL